MRDFGIDNLILKEYDFKVNEVEKIRNIIRLSTQLGNYSIKKTILSAKEIISVHDILIFLDKSGLSVPKFVKNKFGDYYGENIIGRFYVTNWINGRELDFNQREELDEAVIYLANLHRIGFNYPNIKMINFNMNEVLETWRIMQTRTDEFRKKIYYKKNLNGFEQLWLSYYPYFDNWNKEGIELFSQWIIENVGSPLRTTITHGRYYHRNIIVGEDNYLYLVDWHHLKFSSMIRDLYPFFKKNLLKGEREKWVIKWLTDYEEIMPLEEKEKLLLKIYLLFPEDIINLTWRYQQEGETNEKYYIEKLRLRFSQMQAAQSVIKHL